MKLRNSGFRKQLIQPIQEELERATVLLSEELAQEQPESTQKLQPKNVYKERIQHEIKSSIESLQKTMHTGVTKLISTLIELAVHQPTLITEEVRKDLTKFIAFPKVAQSTIEKIRLETAEGKSFQEIFGISEATVEAFYQAARHLYEHQHYQDAQAAFQVLTFINGNKPLFWLALGSSQYFCHHYEQALIAYTLAGHIDPFVPTSHLYSCKCYEELGQIEKALNSLELALIAIRDDQTQFKLVQKIHEEQRRLTQKINK